jgi:hypothetical protein
VFYYVPRIALFCAMCINLFMSCFICGLEGKRCILLMKNLYATTFFPTVDGVEADGNISRRRLPTNIQINIYR